MKTFTKIILSVALGAIVILSIVVASVAWFTSNPDVDANDVTLESARTLTVSFGSGIDSSNDYQYCGQIGNVATGENAPFVYEAGGFTLNVVPSGNSRYGKVKVEFGTVTVDSPIGTISYVLITDLFHIDAKIYVPDNNNGTYVKDLQKNYMRAAEQGDGLLPHYRLISENAIADDGIVMDSSDPTKPNYFSQGTYYLGFTYTFLPETAYQVWTEACAQPPTKDFDEIYGYEFSATGDYLGVLAYTPYQAKYHYGLTRYNRSGDSAPYTYTAAEDGEYVRVVVDHKPIAEVTKYTNASGDGAGAENGTYIKVGDSDEYVRFSRYNRVNGFPYNYHIYAGTEYRFIVACSVEEVSREA